MKDRNPWFEIALSGAWYGLILVLGWALFTWLGWL
jgi:hypothetical protein